MEMNRNQVTSEQIVKLCRKAAAQGAVLLKNDDAVLPLLTNDHVAVFGRCQKEYYRSGTGSGGAVNVPYITNLLDGLRDNLIMEMADGQKNHGASRKCLCQKSLLQR